MGTGLFPSNLNKWDDFPRVSKSNSGIGLDKGSKSDICRQIKSEKQDQML